MKVKIICRKALTLFKLLSYLLVFPLYKKYGTPRIMTIEETIKYVINNKMSVTRFGDGEYLHLKGVSTGLQKNDTELQKKLIEAIKNKHSNLLVCLIDYLNQTNKTFLTKLSDAQFYVRTCKHIKQYIDSDYQYGNANMTRFYIHAIDKSACKDYFVLCTQIWEGADVVIFEGDKTRFGIRNDLLDNAKSVRRVLCPSNNAFIYYEQIISKAKTFDKNCLLLFALGITATIAASDLTNAGYQVIDIGNLDIEYEWFLSGTTKKIAISGKQVSEVTGGSTVNEVLDETYLSQIIDTIGIGG